MTNVVSRLVISILALAAMSAPAASAQAPPGAAQAPAVTLPDDVADMSKEAKPRTDVLVVRVLPPLATPPSVRDASGPNPTVTPGEVTPLGPQSSGDWLVHLSSDDVASDTTQTRFLEITAGGRTASYAYTLTSVPASSFIWTVLPSAGALAWNTGAALPVTVIMGPAPATNVSAHTTLFDDVTAERFGSGDLQLCMRSEGDCEPVTSLAPNQSYRLYLRPAPGAAVKPGKYMGTVELLAGVNRSSPVTLTIYATDTGVQIMGMVWIAVGVFLSLFVTVYVRNGLARAQLLQPAAVLDDSLARLDATVDALEITANRKDTLTRKQIKELRACLTARSLEAAGLIPSLFLPTASPAAEYQTRLALVSGWIVALDQIASGLAGVQRRSGRLDGLDDPKRKLAVAAMETVWKEIDKLSEPAPSGTLAPALQPDVLQTKIDDLLSTLDDAFVDSRKQMTFATGAGQGTASERVSFQISTLGFYGWLVASGLTIVIGIHVLILSRLDFGHPQDLFVCLLWGFGFPVSAAQLSQLTPSSVATTLGVTVPK